MALPLFSKDKRKSLNPRALSANLERYLQEWDSVVEIERRGKGLTVRVHVDRSPEPEDLAKGVRQYLSRAGVPPLPIKLVVWEGDDDRPTWETKFQLPEPLVDGVASSRKRRQPEVRAKSPSPKSGVARDDRPTATDTSTHNNTFPPATWMRPKFALALAGGIIGLLVGGTFAAKSVFWVERETAFIPELADRVQTIPFLPPQSGFDRLTNDAVVYFTGLRARQQWCAPVGNVSKLFGRAQVLNLVNLYRHPGNDRELIVELKHAQRHPKTKQLPRLTVRPQAIQPDSNIANNAAEWCVTPVK
jgi:hypothetical protein